MTSSALVRMSRNGSSAFGMRVRMPVDGGQLLAPGGLVDAELNRRDGLPPVLGARRHGHCEVDADGDPGCVHRDVRQHVGSGAVASAARGGTELGSDRRIGADLPDQPDAQGVAGGVVEADRDRAEPGRAAVHGLDPLLRTAHSPSPIHSEPSVSRPKAANARADPGSAPSRDPVVVRTSMAWPDGDPRYRRPSRQRIATGGGGSPESGTA